MIMISIWLKPILIFNIVVLQLKLEAIHKAGGNSMNSPFKNGGNL